MTKITRIRICIMAALLVSLMVQGSCTDTSKTPATPAGWALENSRRGQLSDHKGKVVLLDFYATWCEPCRLSTPHLVALHKQLEAQGLQIIGLNVGGADDHQYVAAYAKEFGINYPLAIPDEEFIDAFLGINQNIPQTFVIDRQGKTVKRFIGYSEESGQELERVVKATLIK